ncbi:kinase-like domain-containing protein [Tanacetum coccineum]|uniref:Kinase-like domain-containing protein n=1 Tax=Tanacetum coccineum TaxID=301880 RepID=A0ABQ4Y8W2_9ASTR
MPSPKELAHLHIPLKQILKATNNFSDENLIREGGFGEVYKGTIFLYGRQINIVARRLHHRYGQGKIEFWKEIMMLVSLKHKNLVSIVGFCDEEDEKIIINKIEAHESLDKYLSDPDLTWIQRLEICVGVARALSYIHYDAKRDFSVIHRNIKSSKILLDKDWKPKLSGFELSMRNTRARRNRLLLTQLSGTLGYVDPVYENTKSVTPKSDVYSFGVVLFEVLCGRRAFIPGEHEWCPPQEAKPDSKVVNQDEMVVASLNKQMDNPSSSLTNTSPEMYPKSFIYSPPAQKQQPPSSFNNNENHAMQPFVAPPNRTVITRS